MKISRLDEKITTNKKAILYCYTGRSHWTVNEVDAQMCKMSANEVLKKGKEIDQHGSAEIAVRLEKFLYQIRDLRESVRRFILVGLTLTAIGIVGILFAKDFSMNVYFGLFIMMFIFPTIVVCLYFMCQFIYKSLECQKKVKRKLNDKSVTLNFCFISTPCAFCFGSNAPCLVQSVQKCVLEHNSSFELLSQSEDISACLQRTARSLLMSSSRRLND